MNHVELVRKARGAEMPESFWTDPLMYQGGSDGFLSPRDPIPLADEAWGCDLEAEVVVVTGDVPQGVTREQALDHIATYGSSPPPPGSPFAPAQDNANRLRYKGAIFMLPILATCGPRTRGTPNAVWYSGG